MPVHEEHREEHHDGGDGRHQDRHRHLLRGQQHGLLAFLPGGQVAVDVLQLDDGVVDQPPDAQGQAAQGEDVQRLVGEEEQHEGRDDGERNGDADDGGGAQVHQEDQDDQDGEQAALHGLVLQRRHRRADVLRLVERDVELHVAGHAAQLGDGGADRVDDGDGVGPRLLEHAQVDAALAVDAHDLGLVRGQILDLGHVGDAHHALALAGRGRGRAHDHAAQGPHVGHLGVGEDVVVAIAGAQAAAGQEQVRRAHRS